MGTTEFLKFTQEENMNKKYFKVGDTIYRVWLELDGVRGESYQIEKKLSDYAFQVKDRRGRISILQYPRDNLILFPSDARKIYDTYQREWEYLNNKQPTYSNSNDIFLEKIYAGDTVTIFNEDNNKVWKIKIVKANISYEPTLGSGIFKNSIYYKQNTTEFSDIENNEVSENAPIAQALLGKKENDFFSYSTPEGKIISGKILKVER